MKKFLVFQRYKLPKDQTGKDEKENSLCTLRYPTASCRFLGKLISATFRPNSTRVTRAEWQILHSLSLPASSSDWASGSFLKVWNICNKRLNKWRVWHFHWPHLHPRIRRGWRGNNLFILCHSSKTLLNLIRLSASNYVLECQLMNSLLFLDTFHPPSQVQVTTWGAHIADQLFQIHLHQVNFGDETQNLNREMT